jgi:hypothetical protein
MSLGRRKVLIIIYCGRTRDFFKKIFWEKTRPAATIAGVILPPRDPGCHPADMMRLLGSLVILLALTAAAFGEGENRVDFQRDVRPILSNRCFKCHGPAHQEGGARLDQREAALKRKRIVPGNPDASVVIKRITAADDERMPPADAGDRLSPAQVATLRAWIEQGAEYTPHWAYVKPQAAPPRPPSRTAPGRVTRLMISSSPDSNRPACTRRGRPTARR